MIKPAVFNFDVQKDARTITVERSFDAPRDTVWTAWTNPEILCKWWAPKPYECVIKEMEVRPGGRCLYYMQGPKGDRHWSFFDYAEVQPTSFYSGSDGFCDEQGVINEAMPRPTWKNRFEDKDGGTLVSIMIQFENDEDMEKMLKMGFKEGFTQGLEQLDEILASSK